MAAACLSSAILTSCRFYNFYTRTMSQPCFRALKCPPPSVPYDVCFCIFLFCAHTTAHTLAFPLLFFFFFFCFALGFGVYLRTSYHHAVTVFFFTFWFSCDIFMVLYYLVFILFLAWCSAKTSNRFFANERASASYLKRKRHF